MSNDPSNQFPLGLDKQIDTVTTDITYRMISKCGKFRVIFLSVAHPTSTTRGTTKSEICVHEPTATTPSHVAKFRGNKKAHVLVSSMSLGAKY